MDFAKIPMRVLNRPAPAVEVTRQEDGSFLAKSPVPLAPLNELLIDAIGEAARLRPDVTFLAQRAADGAWRRLTYSDLLRQTGAIATWLIRKGYGPGGPAIAILSENSIEHALLTYGALRAGAALVPVSPAYSLTGEPARLEHVLSLVQPGLVFAQETRRFAAALDRTGGISEIVTVDGGRGVAFADLLGALDEGLVAARRREIDADTPAKILFTSGSTGMPKGVVNTQGNLIAALQMVRQVGEAPDPSKIYTILDWLPWHHTYGGNVQINGVLRAAGTMYIDEGRPVPGQFEATIRNLRDVSPSAYGSVPAAYPMLADALERDAALRRSFFKNLRFLSYGGALLPQDLWDRMQRLAVMELGERIPFGCGWGMTETAGTGTTVYWNVERTGLMGLPLPGVILRLIPVGDRMELRIKGPHIMTGYYKRPDLSAEAFDEDGFFRTGDAVRWVDPSNPSAGLEFAGRVAEDFKLQSGTWVQAGPLRLALLEALQPYIHDLVIVGPDRPYLTAMVWPHDRAGIQGDLRRELALRLARFNEGMGGGSTRIARLLLLEEPPSIAAGEVTDKRSINPRLVLLRRAADAAKLYSDAPDDWVILPA